MPKASKQTASNSMTLEGYEGHFEELSGYTVGFETYTADADLAPLFVGLPDDRCQCAHLGYVLKGKVKFTYADGSEEVYETGRPTTPRPDTRRRSTPGPRSSSSARPSRSRRRSRSSRGTWRPPPRRKARWISLAARDL